MMEKKNRFKNNLGHFVLFDPKMGAIGALVLGTVVFFINYDHGIIWGITAALKQGVYTFLIGGILTRLCENLASMIKKEFMAILAAVVIPTTISLILTYSVHSLKGTPEPLNSTIPTLFMAPWGFLWWALRKRKQLKTVKESI
jgi:uncharacterized RDD family membrane protein YckC